METGVVQKPYFPPFGKNIIFSLVFLYKTRENMMFSCKKISCFHVKYVGSRIHFM